MKRPFLIFAVVLLLFAADNPYAVIFNEYVHLLIKNNVSATRVHAREFHA